MTNTALGKKQIVADFLAGYQEQLKKMSLEWFDRAKKAPKYKGVWGGQDLINDIKMF